jgi:hypothetical protein
MNTELSDYYLFFVRDYGRAAVHIAPRFFDIAPDKWLKLTSIYYARFGFKELPEDDSYVGKLANGRDAVRSHRVDAIVLENPEMDDMAKFLYDSWIAKKAQLDKNRNETPPIVLPPPPEPPPMPKPVELPPKVEEPKPPKKPFKIHWGLIATILTALAFALKFLPVPAFVLGIIDVILKIIQAIPGQ